jgi:hypothetical protein
MDHADRKPTGNQQARVGILGELRQHAGHGREDRQPKVGPPGLVDPHADQEDHQLALVLVGHALTDDVGHGELLIGQLHYLLTG